jgi:hypothetical protein
VLSWSGLEAHRGAGRPHLDSEHCTNLCGYNGLGCLPAANAPRAHKGSRTVSPAVPR